MNDPFRVGNHLPTRLPRPPAFGPRPPAFGPRPPAWADGTTPSGSNTSASRAVIGRRIPGPPGLKGRFCQPRPKAWVTGFQESPALKGPFISTSIPHVPFVPFDL